MPDEHQHHHPQHKIVNHIDVNIIEVDGERYHREGTELRIIEEQAHIMFSLAKTMGKLVGHESHGQNVRLVLTTFINNNQFIIMALNLNANQFSLDTLGLIDSDTNLPVAATFANQVFASDNPAIFSTTPDATNPNQTKDVAVAAGVANLNFSADATYTDSVTKQPVTKSLKGSVVMTVAAIVAGENVSLVINQGTPQLQ
jgi:hypothetical protein